MSSVTDTARRVSITATDSQIEFDATVSEQHSSVLSITEHPTEVGAAVSDHAQKEPDELTIHAIISDTPILLDIADRQPSVPGGNPDNRAQQAYQELRRLQDTVALLVVTTETRVYQDMMIKSIAMPKDAPRRHIADLTLQLKAFRRASVETVDAPEPVEPVHKKKRKQGRKQTKPASKEAEEKTSVLGGLINGVFG